MHGFRHVTMVERSRGCESPSETFPHVWFCVVSYDDLLQLKGYSGKHGLACLLSCSIQILLIKVLIRDIPLIYAFSLCMQ